MVLSTAPLPEWTEPPNRRPPRRRRWLLALVLVTVALLAGIGLLLATSDDEPPSAPVAASTTTSAPDVSVAPPLDGRRAAVWPPAGAAAFTDPVAVASDFATTFLEFEAPVVGPFRAGDARSGEVGVRPTSDGPETVVLVRQLDGTTWSVIGASTANIELVSPSAGDLVRSPVTLRGRALAFEGNVVVELREDGRNEPLGFVPVTGGGDVSRPFQGVLEFRSPTEAHGAIVLRTRSAEDGRVWEASVVRVDLDRTEPAAMSVTVYFTRGADGGAPSVVPVQREVERSSAVLAASLRALLAGPTPAERADGLTSWFTSATAGALRSVDLDDGHAVVDLRDIRTVIPNASTSAGSAMLLAELDATVFQFRSVDSAEYRIDGSCEAFSEWIQVGDCEVRRRP